jgi:hypothetical protein
MLFLSKRLAFAYSREQFWCGNVGTQPATGRSLALMETNTAQILLHLIDADRLAGRESEAGQQPISRVDIPPLASP